MRGTDDNILVIHSFQLSMVLPKNQAGGVSSYLQIINETV